MPTVGAGMLGISTLDPPSRGGVPFRRGPTREPSYWRARYLETFQALRKEKRRRAAVEAKLAKMLRQIVSDQEAERKRIARELHDTLGQSLTLLRLSLDGIVQSAPGASELQKRLVEIKTIATDAVREVARLAWDIRPSSLDDIGIDTAIRNLVDRWRACAPVRFELHVALAQERLPPAVETTLYRILQEALTNAVRHAEATEVGVILGSENGHVSMIVEDNGRGFACDGPACKFPRSGRLGLLGMRERLSLVGGSMEIESTPGSGTTLFLRIPLP